jgi:K+-transporting ATPase KdpF subunit
LENASIFLKISKHENISANITYIGLCCTGSFSHRLPDKKKTQKTKNMTVLLILAIAVFGYLIYVLLKPEKF